MALRKAEWAVDMEQKMTGKKKTKQNEEMSGVVVHPYNLSTGDRADQGFKASLRYMRPVSETKVGKEEIRKNAML